MSLTVSETKLYPPHYLASSPAPKSFQARWVVRTRLIDPLETVRAGEAVFLTSPEGSGKTTLIESWLYPALPEAEPEPSVAWLTLDQGDNDPTRFMSALVAALRPCSPGFGEVILANLDAPRPPAILNETASLVREIAHLHQPVTLVMDAFETLSASRIIQAVTFLLAHLPANLRLVIATGSDLAPELEEIRQQAGWKVFTFQDLKLTRSEASELLAYYSRNKIKLEQVNLLLGHTQGMALAVQMAGIVLKRHPDPASFWTDLSQQPEAGFSFLLDQVLEQQMDPVREFLLCTSILDHLTGPLCDLVLRASPSGLQASERGRVTLEFLAKNHLFTVVLDRNHKWFTYHPEFRRLLADRLSQQHPGAVVPLHQRACQWYEANGDLEAAIQHALDSKDEDTASTMIELNVLSLVGEGQLYTALTWLGKLPAGVVLLRPWLSLAEAWASAHEGWKQGVETLLGNVESSAQLMPEAASKRVRGHMAAIRAQIALQDQEMGRADELNRQALEHLPPEDRTIRCYVATQLGTILRQRGQLKSAAEAFSEAIACTRQGQNRSAIILALCQLADLHFLEGLLQKVLALSEEAINLAEIHHLQEGYPLPQAGLAHLYAGIVLLERNELEIAYSHLETSLGFCQTLGRLDATALGYAALASVYRLRGNLERAQQAVSSARASLVEFEAESEQVPAPTNSFLALQPGRIEARLARLQANWGDWSSVQAWIDRHHYSADDSFTHVQVPVYLTLAQVLLSQNRILDTRRLVLRLVQLSEGTGAVYYHTHALVLQALLFQRTRNFGSAIATLQRAIQMAESEKMVRVFLDGVAAIDPTSKTDLYLLVQRLGEGGPGSTYARTILAAIDRQAQHRTSLEDLAGVAARPVTRQLPELDEVHNEPLTEREKQILRYLESYLSHVEIASQLSISYRTVDTIVRNLYRKLGVSEASQAVQRARELGIIQ